MNERISYKFAGVRPRTNNGREDVPHTKHKTNSKVASFSCWKFKLMATADCVMTIAPIWCAALMTLIVLRKKSSKMYMAVKICAQTIRTSPFVGL